MAKSILKVTVQPCGEKVKDRTGKIYPIDFVFSDTTELKREQFTHRLYYEPNTEFRARIMASGSVEILE